MATVYLARDLKHERTVAIKVLRPELSASLGGDRFLREIQVAANLQHPNILGSVRLGRGRRAAVLRHAVRRGRIAPRPAEQGAAAPAPRRAADHPRGGRGARVRPRARDRPPRHQAGEHPAPRRPRAGGRLRHRAGREPGRRREADPDRHGGRHAALHEPRAGARQRARGRPERHLQPGLRAVRAADRPAAVHRPERHGDHGAALDGSGAEPPGRPRHRCRTRSRTRSCRRWRRRRPTGSRR